jgi:hypothetical protein
MSDPVPKPDFRISAGSLITSTSLVIKTCTGHHCDCDTRNCKCIECETCELTKQSDYFMPDYEHTIPPACSPIFDWIYSLERDSVSSLTNESVTIDEIDSFYKHQYEINQKNGDTQKLAYNYTIKNTKYHFIEKDGVIIGADIIVPFWFSNRFGLTPNEIWNYEFLKQLVISVESSGLRFLNPDPIKKRKFRIDTAYNFWKE